MTVVRRRHPRRWPPGVKIKLRAFLVTSTDIDRVKDENDLLEIGPQELALLLEEAPYVAEYQDPKTGRWMSCEGWEAPNFGDPALSPKEVASLVPQAQHDNLPEHGQATWWVAFDAKPEDVLESLVLAGWVPSQAGIDLAVRARRHVDQRDAT